MPEVDDAFADPRLAALYDLAEAGRDDLVHYERIVHELGATSVADIGCGTGTLALALAKAGVRVVGVDPAAASLDIAISKDLGGSVEWILGDATVLAKDQTRQLVDFAVMTGNVAQVFLSDSQWAETLKAAAAALRPGGHLVFETRDPSDRGWEQWTPEQSMQTLALRGGESVRSWVEVTSVDLPYVSFVWTYVFEPGSERLTSTSTLRFRSKQEIDASLVAAGYRVVEVRDAPDRPGREFVFVAQKL